MESATSNGVNPTKLTYEIQSSDIIIALSHININGDVCDVYFKAVLSSEDQSLLDALVAAHDGLALVELPTISISDADGNIAGVSDGRLKLDLLPTIHSISGPNHTGTLDYQQLPEGVIRDYELASVSGSLQTQLDTLEEVEPTFTALTDTPSEFQLGKHLLTTSSGLEFTSSFLDYSLYVSPNYKGTFSDGSITHPFKDLIALASYAYTTYTGISDSVTIFLLPGEYIIDDTLFTSNVSTRAIVGASPTTTVLKPTANVLGKSFLGTNIAITISNLTLDATDIPAFKTTPGSIGYKANEGNYNQIDIRDCFIKGFYTNLSLVDNSNVYLNGCEFSDTTLNITVGSGSLLDSDLTYLFDAEVAHVFSYGDAEIYLEGTELYSWEYSPEAGTGIWATEDSYVELFGGTNLWGLNKNLIVEDDASIRVDNCVLEHTAASPGIEQKDDSTLIIINSRAPLCNEDVSINNPESTYINSYDSSDREITIGTGAEVDATLFSINTGQLTKPKLLYRSNVDAHEALVFKNTSDGQKTMLVSEGVNASTDIEARVLGSNAFAHDAALYLIAEQNGVVNGWQVSKELGSSPVLSIKYMDGTKSIQFNPTGTVQLNSGVAVDKILDEDDFSSNDSTALATQQSIKTFIENVTYSKEEIDAGQLNSMYYTESEINTLSGVMDNSFVHTDGSSELTADWDVGDYTLTAEGFTKGNADVDLSVFGTHTGVLTGGSLNVNSSNDVLLDVASGTCLYVDMADRSDPIVEVLSWDSQTIDPDLAGFRAKWVGVYRTGPGEGALIVDNEFTQEEKRTVAVLGRFWGQGDAHITAAKNYTASAFGMGKTVEDLVYATGSINIRGNIFSAATVSGVSVMQLYRTAGESFRFSANYGDSPLSPNIDISVNETYGLYQYHLQNSHQNMPKYYIDPDYYDNNGTLTEVPVDKWTVQYVYYFPVSQVLHLTYGQHTYDSPTLAMDGIFKDTYNVLPEVNFGAILKCYIVVKKGANKLDDITQGTIIDVIGTDGAIPGINNHGDLGGLHDDDHPQYLNEERGDNRYYTQSELNTMSGTMSSSFVKRDGSAELTADWNAGDYNLTASGFVSGRTRVDYASYANITGILTGGELSINETDNTLIDITAGTSLYVDMSDRYDPLVEILSWEAQTHDPEIIGTETKWLGVQRTGTGTGQIISSYKFSQSDKRNITILGRCWNFLGTDVVTGVGNYKMGAFSFGKSMQDIAYALGTINISGNTFYPTASGSMTLSRAAGEAFRFGANYTNDNTSPNIANSVTISGIDDYSYHIQNASSVSYSEIDADYYDLNGVKTAVDTDKWTIQRVYYYPVSELTLVTYGQYMYDSYSEAVAATTSEKLVLNSGTLEGSTLRAFIILKEGCTDLCDISQAAVLEASSITSAGSSSSGSAGGVTNHANLTGLGEDDHYQYTLVDGTRSFSDKIKYGTHPSFSSDTDIVDKKYVDDGLLNLTTDHGSLDGLGDDDHTQYSRVDGSRSYSNVVSYDTPKTFTNDAQLIDKKYVDDTIVFEHGSLIGLGNDDHTQYLKANGTRELIGKQAYSTHPAFINDTELVDKKYVDDEIAGVTVDHGEMAGLGDDDHTQYHNDSRGDLRYYTKTQVNSILDDHSTVSGVAHDDRYYTESEVDAFVSGLSDDIQEVSSSLSVGALPSCQLRRSTNLDLTATWTVVAFNNTDIENNTDVLEHDDIDTYKLKIKETGLYLITYSSQIYTTNSNECYARILKNGTTVLDGSNSSILVYGGERHTIGHPFFVQLQQNDYISLQMYFTYEYQAIAMAPTILAVTALQGMKGQDGLPGEDGVPGSGSTLLIKYEGVNTSNTPHSSINFKGDNVSAVDAGGGVVDVTVTTPSDIVFGTWYAWDGDDSTTGTNSTSFQEKASLSVEGIPNGYYRLSWFFEWRNTSVSYDIRTRVVTDNTNVVMEQNEESKDSHSWHLESGFVITQLNAGNHFFDLDYSSESTGMTVYIRRARFEIWRVS